MSGTILGREGELLARLLDVAEDPAPQVRAVVTTLLIKGLADDESARLIELMVRSDGAARIVNGEAAEVARSRLHSTLTSALSALALDHGELEVVRAWRDHLLTQMDRWASRAVDDADNRRRAERFLLFANNPSALAAAKRRGFLIGMSAEDLRALARKRGEGPVAPETVIELWSEHEAWRRRVDTLVGEDVLELWSSARRAFPVE